MGVIEIAPAELKRCVLPLLAVTDRAEWNAIGTCFIVAVLDALNAVAVTATHNLREAPKKSPRYRAPASVFAREPTWADVNVELHTLLRDGDRTGVAIVARDFIPNEHDVALLWLRLPESAGVKFTMSLPIDVTPFDGPGRQILAAGYPEMTAKSHVDSDRRDFRVEMNTPMTYVHGRIESFAPAGARLVQSPGMFLSCALPHGMSGGPVIELRGSTPIVRGVVSSGLKDRNNGDGREVETQAFASHPLPIAGVPLAGLPTLHLEDGTQLVAPTLVELAAKGLVKDPRGSFKHVAVTGDGERVITTWSGPAPSDD